MCGAGSVTHRMAGLCAEAAAHGRAGHKPIVSALQIENGHIAAGQEIGHIDLQDCPHAVRKDVAVHG